jgi:hypothetical protein
MKKTALILGWLASLVLVSGLAANLAMKNQRAAFGVALNKALNETQAMLWFNHLHQFRDIEADLANECTEEAHEKLRIAIDGEMRLLSSFHEENPDSSLNKYISARDPELLSQLDSFESKYGSSWTVPQCKKREGQQCEE